MHARNERGVRKFEHAMQRSSKFLPDWENAHLFLELVRLKSFRAAAEYLGLSVNALRAHIAEFESSLGVTLITRHVDGIRPTEEGERVFSVACQMEQNSFDIVQVSNPSGRALTGEVRLAVTEGLGALWVGSRILEFQRANPKLTVDIHAAMRSLDVLRLEADISVQLTRPTAKDLRMVKLGCLHLVLFASPPYIAMYGQPVRVGELVNHRIVLQADDTSEAQQFFDRVFHGTCPDGLIALRSNVASLHYWSIVQGSGIGHLPTYVYALGAPIVPLKLSLHRSVDIWMTYHAGAAQIPRVRSLIDWLIKAFSPRLYPWFRDEYIAPEDLAREYRGKPLRNPFAGLSPDRTSDKGR
jgi:DNA-binding transcriptional LysR family regulator